MIKLSEKIIDVIEYHAEQSYPEECCGMILGYNEEDFQLIEEVVRIENSQDENRRRRFLISPEQYRRAEELARKRKMDLLGFYHSHPDHPAVPSQFDTDHALPFFTYIIVAVNKGKAAAMTAWLLNENRSKFNEQKIFIEASTPEIQIPSGALLFHHNELINNELMRDTNGH